MHVHRYFQVAGSKSIIPHVKQLICKHDNKSTKNVTDDSLDLKPMHHNKTSSFRIRSRHRVAVAVKQASVNEFVSVCYVSVQSFFFTSMHIVHNSSIVSTFHIINSSIKRDREISY